MIILIVHCQHGVQKVASTQKNLVVHCIITSQCLTCLSDAQKPEVTAM